MSETRRLLELVRLEKAALKRRLQELEMREVEIMHWMAYDSGHARLSSPHPAPNAAEPIEPTGDYREIKLGGSSDAAKNEQEKP